MANKKTGWLRIGRSGDTIDGRVIDEKDIREAAASYDTNFYTALIWPDHRRWFNMGKVFALRSEKNDEGGLDLFAKIEGNDFYQSINAAGQRLFTSMELFRNFRKSGKTYLNGLGATDEPASVATSEVHFSRIDTDGNRDDLLVSAYTENTPQEFNDPSNDDEDKLFNRLANFFSKKTNEDDMSKEALEALQSEVTALTAMFKSHFPEKVTPTENTADDEKPDDKYSALETAIADLASQFSELKATLTENANDENEGNEADAKYTAIKKSLDDLTAKFNAALKEKPGTDSGENDGNSVNAQDYM